MRPWGSLRIGLCVFVLGLAAATAPAQGLATKLIQRLAPKGGKEGLDSVITVNVVETDLARAVRTLAEECGVNVALGRDVKGSVTCSLTNVTARTALEAFLYSNGYDFIERGSVLIVIKKGQEKQFATAPPTRRIVRRSFHLPYTGREDKFSTGSTTPTTAESGVKGVDDTIREMLSPRGRMAYYERQHLIVVEDDEANVAMIEAFVKALWRVPKQVLIDARLVEVTLEDGEDLGLRWTIQQKAGSLRSTGSVDQVTGEVEFPGTILNAVAPTLGLDKAFTYGLVNANVEIVLEALGSRRRINLRSSPRILVVNHRTASIVVGQEIPYLSSVESTSAEPIRTYEFKEVAVRLDVTPHIADDNMVHLDVHPSVKSVIGYTDEPRQPILSTREAVTNVVVRDGFTLIIGGLLQRTMTKEWTETPYLARIPLIGLLFRQRSRTDTKNDLIFLLSPRVVTPEVMDEMMGEKAGITAEPPKHRGESEPGFPKW